VKLAAPDPAATVAAESVAKDSVEMQIHLQLLQWWLAGLELVLRWQPAWCTCSPPAAAAAVAAAVF
jgi:hypothetical protein